MDLRELKKEVSNLDSIHLTVQKLQNRWVKTLRKDTNLHLPFLKNISPEVRFILNGKIQATQKKLENLKEHQSLQTRMEQFSRHLVNMKLLVIQGDHKRAKEVAAQLTNDEFLNASKTIQASKTFEQEVTELSDHYHEINELLQKNLSLEEALLFMEIPHYTYLMTLQKTAQKQQRIVRQLAANFVAITKEASLKNVPHR